MSDQRCYARQHMTLEEYGLWQYARTVAYQSGVFYMDARGIAKRFSETGKDAIYRVARRLEVKGWFRRFKSSRRHKKTGTWAASQYQPLSHDQWVADHPGECTCLEIQTGEPVEKSRQAVEIPVEQPSPVEKSQFTSLEISTGLSRNLDSPVEKSRHSFVGFVCKEHLVGESCTHALPLPISQSQTNGNSTSQAKTSLPESGQAEEIWTATLGKLSERVDPHSFDTWLKPTRGIGVSEGKLFVRIPRPAFSYIGEKFSKELGELLPELSVQFVVRDHAA